MLIYKVTNTVNNKVYIGQTIKTLKERWNGHLNDIKRFEYPLYRAMRKYGVENFNIETLVYTDTIEMLNELEEVLVKRYKDEGRSYNIREGGGSKGKHSEETRKKISEAQKGEKSPNFGKKHSEETRKKISEVKKGKKHSGESRKKMSEVQKGRKHSDESRKKMSEVKKGKYIAELNPNFGKKHSEETRRKMSDARKEYHIKKRCEVIKQCPYT